MKSEGFPNIFSVDLEDWYQGVEIDIDQWDQFTPRIRQGMDPLLDLLNEANTKATFFVLGYQAEKTPDLIREISDAGHDIASRQNFDGVKIFWKTSVGFEWMGIERHFFRSHKTHCGHWIFWPKKALCTTQVYSQLRIIATGFLGPLERLAG